MEQDVVSKCYSDLITSEVIPDTSKQPFTDEEVDKVWAIKDQEWVDSVLVFLYSGFRISELLGIKTANVDLKEGTIKGGTKIKAGKDRIVPIHSKIIELVKHRMNEGHEYLFAYNGNHCSNSQYYVLWDAIMEQLDIDKTPHECRHTFRSRLDSAGANSGLYEPLDGTQIKGSGGKGLYS